MISEWRMHSDAGWTSRTTFREFDFFLWRFGIMVNCDLQMSLIRLVVSSVLRVNHSPDITWDLNGKKSLKKWPSNIIHIIIVWITSNSSWTKREVVLELAAVETRWMNDREIIQKQRIFFSLARSLFPSLSLPFACFYHSLLEAYFRTETTAGKWRRENEQMSKCNHFIRAHNFPPISMRTEWSKNMMASLHCTCFGAKDIHTLFLREKNLTT